MGFNFNGMTPLSFHIQGGSKVRHRDWRSGAIAHHPE